MSSLQQFAVFSHNVNSVAIDPSTGAMIAALDNGDLVAVHGPGDMNNGPGETASDVIVRTGGNPNGVAFDLTGRMFIADLAHKAILTFAEGEPISQMVNEHENEAFKGPNSLAVHGNGTIFFTDSGPIGTTTLEKPNGSVFAITGNDRILVPIMLQCLAHPSGICLSPDQMIVYVAETGRNQIIRIVQSRHSAYVFQTSIFYRFSGGFGPMGLATDPAGNLYVSQFEFSHMKMGGTSPAVSVLSPRGVLLATVASGRGTEACSIAWGDTEAKDPFLYVAESTSIHRCAAAVLPHP